MKKILIPFLFTLILFSACSPQIESRERMDAVAARTADSLDRSLNSALNDPAKEMAQASASITTMAPVSTSTEQDK